jgi:hypothetical protein
MKTKYPIYLLSAVAVVWSGVISVRGDIGHYKNAVTSEAALISYYTFETGDAADTKSANQGTTEGTVSFDSGIGGGNNKALVLGQERWIGALDEVAFYSDALTANAIQSHYQAFIGAPAQRPILSFTRSGTQVTLSWPADAIGFVLESATVLPAASWTPVPGAANNSVTVDAVSGARFFRLRQ